jgi:hypothetical protein
MLLKIQHYQNIQENNRRNRQNGFLTLVRRFNPAEQVVEKSVIL